MRRKNNTTIRKKTNDTKMLIKKKREYLDRDEDACDRIRRMGKDYLEKEKLHSGRRELNIFLQNWHIAEKKHEGGKNAE